MGVSDPRMSQLHDLTLVLVLPVAMAGSVK
jgi:hypothetical protein